MDCYKDYSKFELGHKCCPNCTCDKCNCDEKCHEKCEEDPCKCLLKGDKGERGDQGEKGKQGIQGIQGERGEKGDRGDQGEKGEQGIQGIQGERGKKGERGDTGLKGDTGAQGVKGEKGDTGAKGEKGERGDTGLKGDTGAQGVKGEKGDTGAKGEKGDRGDQGIQGLTGVTGAKGDTGATGSQGVQGIQGPQGLTGATGTQGPVGPKGDPCCCCGQPGPVGATGAKGDSGTKGDQGEQGKAGASVCPCEIVNGKVSSFLIENGFDFTASLDASYGTTLESNDEIPAKIFDTWTLEFGEEEIVPLCKIESINLSFTSLQEKDTFISLLSPVITQTLSCCHNCATCDDCEELLQVDQYGSIIDMPDTCNYEYSVEADCNCPNCDRYAKRFSLCNFANSTGEKLRGTIENKKDLGKGIAVISTLKNEFLANNIVKTIELTGLSSVVLSYEEDGEFKVAIVCLEDVRYIKFTDLAQ